MSGLDAARTRQRRRSRCLVSRPAWAATSASPSRRALVGRVEPHAAALDLLAVALLSRVLGLLLRVEFYEGKPSRAACVAVEYDVRTHWLESMISEQLQDGVLVSVVGQIADEQLLAHSLGTFPRRLQNNGASLKVSLPPRAYACQPQSVRFYTSAARGPLPRRC